MKATFSILSRFNGVLKRVICHPKSIKNKYFKTEKSITLFIYAKLLKSMIHCYVSTSTQSNYVVNLAQKITTKSEPANELTKYKQAESSEY